MDARRRWLLAAVCGVAVASIYAAQPILKPMGRDLDLPTELTGWLVATGQVGYLLGLVLLVPLGDLVDRRRLIAVHLTLTAAGMIMTASASAAWLAFLGLATAGLFAVVVQTAVAYAAAVSTPGERGRNIGVVTSGVVVGILGARIAAGWLSEHWGWRSVYIVLAVLALALAILVLAILPAETRVIRAVPYRRVVASLGGLFGQRLFLARGLITLFLFASFGSLWSGLSLPLADEPWQLSASQIGLFGIAGLAVRWAPAEPAGGRMQDGRTGSQVSRSGCSSSRGQQSRSCRGHYGFSWPDWSSWTLPFKQCMSAVSTCSPRRIRIAPAAPSGATWSSTPSAPRSEQRPLLRCSPTAGGWAPAFSGQDLPPVP